MEVNKLDLFELIRILAARKWVVIWITSLIAAGLVAYSLLTPQIFASRASFFAVGEDSAQLPLNIPGLSGLASSLMGSSSTPQAENFVTVMRSRTFSEDVIRRFNLIEYFEYDHADSLRNLDDALETLRGEVISMDFDTTSGLVVIRARTKDKQLSLDIVNYYLERLDRYNRSQKLTQGKLNREFLEGRVLEIRAKLDSLIVENQKFQERSNAISLETQAKAIVESYSDLIAESMKAEIALELVKANYGAQSPLVKEAELRLDHLKRQIRELEASGKTPQYLINIGKLPKLTADYMRLEMDLKIYQSVFTFIYPQYEAARLSELKDMPTLEILDHPRLAGRRDYPKRAQICIIGTMLGFMFAAMVAFTLELMKRHKHRLAEIKASFLKQSGDGQNG